MAAVASTELRVYYECKATPLNGKNYAYIIHSHAQLHAYISDFYFACNTIFTFSFTDFSTMKLLVKDCGLVLDHYCYQIHNSRVLHIN